MKKIPNYAVISQPVQSALSAIAEKARPRHWKINSPDEVKEFKAEVEAQGLVSQEGRCAWCTLKLGGGWSRTCHRDHIAPKSKYKAWTFLPENIALSCENCNGFAKKGTTDTISKLHADYASCEFSIIHPYFDDPAHHLNYIECELGLPVAVEKITDKGSRTIKLFGLDDPLKTHARAAEMMLDAALGQLPQAAKQKVIDALAKPSP